MSSPKHPEELTADNWETCDNIWVMIDFWTDPELRPHPPDERKVRLLLLEALQSVRGAIRDPRSMSALDAAEACIDVPGFPIPVDILVPARRAVLEAHAIGKQRGADLRPWRAARATFAVADPDLMADDLPMPLWVETYVDIARLKVPEQHPPDADPSLTALFHEVFGNPFSILSFDRAWRTTTAEALAAGIYADRAWDRMPVLADALEDAGCDDARVLDHCRTYPVHARGCWVVDAVLGKS